jgi:peptidyl-prolyl cis-trans isomerase C
VAVVFVALLIGWTVRDQRAKESRIVVTDGDVERLRQIWDTRSSRPPTDAEIAGLIEEHIHDEVLYREALRLGLDRNDQVIRRRLVQKMQFVARSGRDLDTPPEDELEAWFEQHRDDYRTGQRLSFLHVYFNPDQPDAEGRAASVLAGLRSGRGADWAAEQGDRFLLEMRYGGESVEEIARLFGAEFAESVETLEDGKWEGPIRSGYGWHLVLVEERTPETSPELADVRSLVERDVRANRLREAEEQYYNELRSKYEIHQE